MLEDIIAASIKGNPYRALIGYAKRRQPTRRERISWRLWTVRNYFYHLGLAILNRCDRDEEDDW